MSILQIAIPGTMGLLLIAWPQSMFLGSKVTPDQKKIGRMRGIGALLLLVATLFLIVRLADG